MHQGHKRSYESEQLYTCLVRKDEQNSNTVVIHQNIKMEYQKWPEIAFNIGDIWNQYVTMITKL